MRGKKHGTWGDFPPNTSAFFFPLYSGRTLFGDSKFTTGEVLQ